MPRKKDQRSNIRWNNKNQLYLQRLGLIDQHGRSKKETQSVSEFVNQCVAIVCESSMNPRKVLADSDELRNAYAIMQYKELIKELAPLIKKKDELRRLFTDEELLKA